MILSSAEKIKSYTEKGWWGARTLDDLLQAARQATPDRLALLDAPNRRDFTDGAPQRLTYAALGDLVDQIAVRFIRAGLTRDDIVCTQLPNIVDGVAVLLAAARLGVIVSPIPVQYREHEVSHILKFTAARAFVTVKAFKDHSPTEMMVKIRGQLPALQHVFTFDQDETNGLPRDPVPLSPDDRDLLRNYLDRIRPTANDIVTICWTSGTEANPKGVPRSHNHWFAIGHVCSEAGQLSDGDRLLNPFPMVNMAAIGSMLFPWLMCRGTLIQHHPFDLPVFLEQITKEKVNYTIAAPALLNMLLKNEDILAHADLSSLKCLGSGSAPLSPWMVEGWQEKYGIGVMNFFGANEGTALFSSMQDIPDPAERARFFPRFGVAEFTWKPRAAGWMKTRLVDPDTGEEITEPDRAGELRITGATIFDGYFRAEEKNDEIFDEQGYYKTGDTFKIAGAGKLSRFYKYVGRSKEIIIRGGMNISPGELDGLFDSHPKVKEAAAVGYPDDSMGERVCAVIVPHEGQTLTLEELNAHLREKNIAVFKLPEKICLVNSLPRNPMGKVMRRDLIKYITSS